MTEVFTIRDLVWSAPDPTGVVYSESLVGKFQIIPNEDREQEDDYCCFLYFTPNDGPSTKEGFFYNEEAGLSAERINRSRIKKSLISLGHLNIDHE